MISNWLKNIKIKLPREKFKNSWQFIKLYFEAETYIKPSKPLFVNVIIIFVLILLLRSLGLFQFVELDLLDYYFQTRPIEALDSRIVMVAIDEDDRQKFSQYPMSDYELYELLSSIQKYSPRAIGLDLYRDEWVNPDYKEGKKKLTNFFDDPVNKNVIGIEKWLSGPNSPRIGPNEILAAYGQIGSNDIFVDLDNVVRRTILFPDLKERPKLASLNYILATKYLQKEGVEIPLSETERSIKIGAVDVPPLHTNSGGYVNLEDRGYQILLNYRSTPDRFLSVGAFEVISNKVNPEFFKDKVVIICTTMPSFPDILNTPFGFDGATNPGEIFGGWYQANATSQLIAAALDDRPLIKTWPEGIEVLWIFVWIYLIANWIWSVGNGKNSKIKIWDWDFGEKTPFYETKPKQKLFWAINTILASISAISVYFLALLAFKYFAWWIPVFPVIIGILLALVSSLVSVYIIKLKEAHKTKNDEVIKIGNKLKVEQKKLIAQERLASIGQILSPLGHDLANTFGPAISFNEASSKKIARLKQILDKYQGKAVFTPEDNKAIDTSLKRILENIDLMRTTIDSTNALVEKIRIYTDRRKEEVELKLVKKNINQEIELIIRSIQFGWRVSFNSDRYRELHDFKRIFWTTYDESIDDFYLDLTDLQQVMQNLIYNALDTVQAKKGQLALNNYQPRIEIVTKNLGENWLEIIVRDNGEGMEKEIKEQIFQPLFSTKEERGIGLGLFSVQNCLERTGGLIKCDSNPGVGTTFVVTWRKWHRQESRR